MRLFHGLLLLSLVLLSFGSAASKPPSATIPPKLYLQRGTIDLTVASQTQADPWLQPIDGYAVIQFSGPILLKQRQAVAATGLEIVEYLPDYAYLVRGSAAQQAAARTIDGFYARGAWTLADKVQPGLLKLLQRGQYRGLPLRTIGWDNQLASAEQAVKAQGLTLDAIRSVDQMLQLARISEVRWIEVVSTPKLIDQYARQVQQVEPVWMDRQLYGQNQIVAYTDTGLDTGSLATLSNDFANRIQATQVLSAGSNWDDNHGHGTHVAGSIAGNGALSGSNPASHSYTSSMAGIAPEAKLVVQAFEADVNGNIVGLPTDFYPMYQQAYNAGARIHSNSWGDVTGPVTDTEALYGGYPYSAQRTDQFLWEHPDYTMLFGAGNSGADGEVGEMGFCTGGNGVVDPDSLLTPATAKNVITVGASESPRPTGGYTSLPWLLLSFCFATEPILSDTLSDDANGMAAFSSRGPTDDGRIKPDLVAPGTNIVSTRSYGSGASTLWGVHETNGNYVYSGGTSMATPLVAGTVALIREWLATEGLSNPSAAVIKSIALNTTVDIAPGQYGTGVTQEIPYNRPNSVAGWGRSNLSFITKAAPYDLWVDDHAAGLSTGQTVSYNHTTSQPLTVLTNTQPLRVMLNWTDPPASLAAAQQLVNDLDLVVIGPDGTRYYGNNQSTGDRTNNLEGVIINTPQLGAYQIEVNAHNVPIASQAYGLAVAGPLRESNGGGTPTPTTAPTNTPTTGPTNTATATNPPTITVSSTSTATTAPSNTPTATNPPTITVSNTPTATTAPSNTPTATNPPTITVSNTPTATTAPSNTPTTVVNQYQVWAPWASK
ncbi:S8 family serine peptidase [Herpetosiphon llansteffanensis]|uniref:S8 family serine peptidase n=1 Tax=Herpetosiphon llansteffanensis TaxID=2094568 RepID=UPI000D7BE777|nr:S8 family serine peptidase [Herpetosiphon llansteffanensis]